jgi:hypothetical protein
MTRLLKAEHPEIRRATREEVEAFYGRSVLWTMDAYVAVLNGQTIAAGGVYYENGYAVAFCDFRPEMRHYRKTIVEGARLFLELFSDRLVTARAEPGEPTALRFLERLGFKPYDDPVGGKFFARRPEVVPRK